MPGPAASCLIIGVLLGALLWALGESTWAVLVFVAEAIGWAALYAATNHRG